MATKPSNSNQRPGASLPTKRYTPFKLSLQTLKALDFLTQKKGFNRTTVAELAIQRMAEQEGYRA